jgi:hypothetical protein
MKSATLFFAILSMSLLSAFAIAQGETQRDALNGTWSGGWTPAGGVRDAMTIELKHDEKGQLLGRFVSPVSTEFTKATFTGGTRTLQLETMDAQSGKRYKLNGKVAGTEIKGNVAVGDQSGDVLLIKWTYVPRIGR